MTTIARTYLQTS